MAWVEPQFSRGQVDAAGAYLAGLDFDSLDLSDEDVVGGLRQGHRCHRQLARVARLSAPSLEDDLEG
jgi:hypothetical protein